MAGVRDHINEQNIFERRLGQIMGWSFVEEQGKGSCIDYNSPDGTKIEVKFDWDSISTGNHYLEYAQTSDGGMKWVPSGFSISAEEADLWVIINEEWMRILSISSMREMVKENRSKMRIAKTRAGVNHNQAGQFSKAYLVPFEILDNYVILKTESPIKRD